MSRQTTYRPGPDVSKDEELRDSKGRPVDDAYVQAAVDDAITKARGRMGPPRPGRSHPPQGLSTR